MFAVERLSEQQSEICAAVGRVPSVEDELVGRRIDLVLVDGVAAGVWVGGGRDGDAARLRVGRLRDALPQTTLRELGSVVVHVQYLDLDLFIAAAYRLIDRLSENQQCHHTAIDK